MSVSNYSADELVKIWATLQLRDRGIEINWKDIKAVYNDSWTEGYCETCEYEVDGIIVADGILSYEIQNYDFKDAVADILELSKMSEDELNVLLGVNDD